MYDLDILQKILITESYKTKLLIEMNLVGLKVVNYNTYITVCNTNIIFLHNTYIIQRLGKIVSSETNINKVIDLCRTYCNIESM